MDETDETYSNCQPYVGDSSRINPLLKGLPEEKISFLRHQLANRWLELDALEEQLKQLHARRKAAYQAWKDARLRVDFAESFAYLHTSEN
jgi:flagellar motility protein MotE (MotC chaperone)